MSTREPQHAELVLRTRTGERRLVAARWEAIELHDTVYVLASLRELRNLSSGPAPTGAPRDASGLIDRSLATRFSEALRRGARNEAEAAVDAALDRGVDIAAIHTQMIEPAMRSIGELWERGEISAGEEHLATAISEDIAALISHRVLDAPPASRERVMMSAVQGEHHVLGLRLAADVLEGAGYDVLYLGADVPLDALLTACRIHRPDVVGLTVGMSLNVPTVIREVHEVTQLEHAPRAMVGGRAAADAVRYGLSVPVVAHSDEVLAAVEALLAAPPTDSMISAAVAARVPFVPTVGPKSG